MVAEGKVITIWILAIVAAAYIDTTPKLSIEPICSEIETSIKEAELIDQLDELNQKIDSLIYVVQRDSIVLKQ